MDDLAARLERERAAADAKYNEALTALDAAVTRGTPTLPIAPTESGMHAAATRALIEIVGRQAAELARFETRLVVFLQQITGFVESKERAIGGPEIKEQIAQLRRKVAELERNSATRQLGNEATPERGNEATRQLGSEATRQLGNAAGSERGLDLGQGAYVGFEDQFRGSREEIARRIEDYLPLFDGASNVLDIGCGRGELLEMLKARGVSARGVDLNPSMAEECRARGLDAEAGDALAYLERQPDASLGGVIAIQVVEHLEPRMLRRLLDLAFLKMRPGAPLVLETINAACWMAFFETYIRDLTHARPLHPDTLKYLVQSAGFSSVDVRFRAPVRDEDRLPTVAELGSDPQQIALARALNAHAERLNARLFSSMDYAVVARR
jgi:O-antigen chain-terminating methyltransferase